MSKTELQEKAVNWKLFVFVFVANVLLYATFSQFHNN